MFCPVIEVKPSFCLQETKPVSNRLKIICCGVQWFIKMVGLGQVSVNVWIITSSTITKRPWNDMDNAVNIWSHCLWPSLFQWASCLDTKDQCHKSPRYQVAFWVQISHSRIFLVVALELKFIANQWMHDNRIWVLYSLDVEWLEQVQKVVEAAFYKYIWSICIQ